MRLEGGESSLSTFFFVSQEYSYAWLVSVTAGVLDAYELLHHRRRICDFIESLAGGDHAALTQQHGGRPVLMMESK